MKLVETILKNIIREENIKMKGIIFPIIAGIFIAMQGVFNTRVSAKIGLWETNTIVMAIGFITAAIITIFIGNGSFTKISGVNKIYLLGGMFGVVVVYCIMKGISLLGATYSVGIVIVSQLIVAMIIDTFGLFGSPKISFDITKPGGVLIIIIGVIVFKLKG